MVREVADVGEAMLSLTDAGGFGLRVTFNKPPSEFLSFE